MLWEYFLLWVTELALAALTHDYRLSSLKRKCISPVRESAKHKLKGLQGPVSVEDLLPGLQMAVSLLCSGAACSFLEQTGQKENFKHL